MVDASWEELGWGARREDEEDWMEEMRFFMREETFKLLLRAYDVLTASRIDRDLRLCDRHNWHVPQDLLREMTDIYFELKRAARSME